jgi:signal transduction histidine kinase
MKKETSIEDLIGLNYTRLGFFGDVQIKIKELQESNLKLEQTTQQIQAILDGITDVMAVISVDFRVISVNNVFFEVFKHARPQGAHCYEIFRGRHQPCLKCPLVCARDDNRICRELAIFPLNGENRQFEITASPLRDAEGQPSSILILKRDVTLEKEYQAKYYQAEKMATIGLLAAGVGHEINNPLTAISGFAEGLERRLPKLEKRLGQTDTDQQLLEDFKEYVETIRRECERCRDIVLNLLTFSPRERTALSRVNLNNLVIDVLKLLRHDLKERPRSLISLKLGALEADVNGVGAELKQVILNLVLNALDAVANQGEITIQTRSAGDDWLILTVEDDGCGIAPENLDKLFEPFFTTKPVGQGIGIGLSTCYNIIRQHGGEIAVKSEKGKGSIFEVKLPQISR